MPPPYLHSFPTRRSSDLGAVAVLVRRQVCRGHGMAGPRTGRRRGRGPARPREGPSRPRSEEHTSELQSPCNLVCRLLLEKKKTTQDTENNDNVNQQATYN